MIDMSKELSDFQVFFNDRKFKFTNNALKNLLTKFRFSISNEINDFQNILYLNNVKQSKVIIIDLYRNQQFYIIAFKDNLQVVYKSNFSSIIKKLSDVNPKLKFCFISNTPDINDLFDKTINNNIIEFTETFSNEINSFKKTLELPIKTDQSIKNIWGNVYKCISGYLIKQSYLEKVDSNRMESFFKNDKQNQNIDNIQESDYIFIKRIGQGSCSSIDLIYLIKNEELAVLKKDLNLDSENEKLREREYNNYTNLKHPLLPRFIGHKNEEFNVIEFIYGETLEKIETKKLSSEEKVKIILELVSIFEYLHCNHYIYRDLKPNNIMIDKNKDVVLIDFDRMILYDSKFDDMFHTNELGNCFTIAPEINTNNFSFECDIYSIGQMIYYIMTEKIPSKIRTGSVTDFGIHSEFFEIYYLCTKKKPTERPSIMVLSSLLRKKLELKYNSLLIPYDNELHKMSINDAIQKISIDEKNNYILTTIGHIYADERNEQQDLEKSIEYYSSAAQQKYSEALFSLGFLYSESDINESIKYLKMASELNHSYAQFFHGIWYLNKNDINETEISILYLLHSIKQNNSYAQYCLGIIYYEGKYVARDINQSIIYLELAANQNNSDAQYFLGKIYYEGKYIDFDINKSIKYFQVAADRNNPDAQFYLGKIYYDGIHITRDINKSIQYLTHSANQNNSDAQFILGEIYYEGKYISLDINKSIYYLTLSANQNNSDAQFILGKIYYENKYISRDTKKSHYYLAISAKQRNKNAINYLNNTIFQKISDNVDKKINLMLILAENNDPDAQYALGVAHLDGEYVEYNINKSMHYLTLSASKNNPYAQFFLGKMYCYGNHVKCDINKAIHYLSLSANQNFDLAQCFLGAIYYENRLIQSDINKAIYYLSCSANQNNPIAQFILGEIYIEGKYINRDVKKSVYYLSLSANQNCYDAQYILGKLYYEGIYIARDINKSIYYLSLSAKKNNNAQCLLGQIYYVSVFVRQDINKSEYYLSLSANNKNAMAQLYLGHLYILKKHNINKGIKYLSLSANQNNIYAQLILGFVYCMKEFATDVQCYLKVNQYLIYSFLILFQLPNISFPKEFLQFDEFKKDLIDFFTLSKDFPFDINKSIFYLTLSAKYGFPEANILLSLIYSFSSYVVHDLQRSNYYLQKIKSQNPTQKLNLSIFSLCLNIYSAIKYRKNNIEFIDYLKKNIYNISNAADQNYPIAQYLLGIMYYYGIIFKKDINKSIYYLIKAADYNIPEAHYLLGNIFFYGKKVPKNISKSIMYYQLAAEYGQENAQYKLGIYYLKGKYVKQDIDKGIRLLLNSAKNGEKYAYFTLGCIYHREKYVKRNINKSIHYYKEGSSFNNPFAKNNLAVIYKNGFGSEVAKNIGYAIELLKEAVRLDKEPISKYNLALIYLFDENIKSNIDDSIELLIKSYRQGFKKSLNLLYISLMLKHQQNIEYAINDIENRIKHKYHKTANKIIQFIRDNNSNEKLIFDEMCELYKKIDFVYNYSLKMLQTDIFLMPKLKKKQQIESNKYFIDSNFYDGFGII